MIDMPFPAFDPHNAVLSPSPYVYQAPTDFLDDKYDTYMSIIFPLDTAIDNLYEVARKNRLTVEQMNAFSDLLDTREEMINEFHLLDYKKIEKTPKRIEEEEIENSIMKIPHPQDD
jgi:hypothetical protein